MSISPTTEHAGRRQGRLRSRTSRSLLRAPAAQALGAATLYAAYALWLTWPLVLHPGSSVFGVPAGDLGASVTGLRGVVDNDLFPFVAGQMPEFNAPFGYPQPWALNLATLPSTAVFTSLAYAFGPVGAHAVFLWLGFVLSGTAMFLLARRVTGSAAAALIAGFGFAFYPFAVNKGLAHLHFVHGWPLVLVLWRMLELASRPTVRNGVLAGAATAFGMWWTPYYILFAPILAGAAGVVVIVAALLRRSGRQTARALVCAAGVVAVFVAGLGALQWLGRGGEAGGAQSRPYAHLLAFSARPHELVLPDRNNLLVGSRTGPYLEAHIHSSNFSESSLYLGLSLLALAALGLLVTLRRALAERRAAAGDPRVVGAVAAAVAALAAAAFSMPPQVTVAGRLVNFPMWYVWQLTSTFRSVSRLVIVVEMAVCLLAAVGLAAILARRRPPVAAVLTAVVLAVVALDLWARPSAPVSAFEPPSIYERIERLGPGALAEYPLQPAEVPDSTAVTWQYAHRHPVLQGYPAGSSSESRKLELADLTDRETAGDLAALGVRWVLVRPNQSSGEPGRGFRPRITGDPGGTVYEVTAPPSRTQVDAASGFDAVEGTANHHFRWMTANGGRLYVRADCGRCRGELQFGASSAARPRVLVVRDAAGKEIARRAIPVTPTRVSIPLSFARQTTISLYVTPNPAPLAGSPDPRSLGIVVEEPHFRLGGPR